MAETIVCEGMKALVGPESSEVQVTGTNKSDTRHTRAA